MFTFLVFHYDFQRIKIKYVVTTLFKILETSTNIRSSVWELTLHSQTRKNKTKEGVERGMEEGREGSRET